MDKQMNISQRIKAYYDNSGGDSAELFREILQVSKEIGLNVALTILERCIIEKLLA